MSGDGLARLYDRLTPEERFRLSLEAGARRDHDERERLVMACPKKTYRMPDVAFMDRGQVSERIAVAALLDLLPRLAKVAMLESTLEIARFLVGCMVDAVVSAWHRGFSEGCDHAWKVAGKEGQSPRGDKDLEKLAAEVEAELKSRFAFALLEETQRTMAAEAKAVWEAFTACCREDMGLEPETVVRATVGSLPDGLERLTGVEVDPERLAYWREAFGKAWRQATE